MRRYSPKDNVQAKAKYTDRFWVAPKTPKESVEEGSFFAKVLENLKNDNIDVLNSYIELGHLVIEINPEQNVDTLKSLRDSSCFKMCVELSAVDYLAQDGEFEIFYLLLNLDEAKRVRVDTRIKKDQAIESIVPVFDMAKFAEREMYDMFGIYVNNHPYLKRIIILMIGMVILYLKLILFKVMRQLVGMKLIRYLVKSIVILLVQRFVMLQELIDMILKDLQELVKKFHLVQTHHLLIQQKHQLKMVTLKQHLQIIQQALKS